jgi:hypothetical protein
MGGLTIRFLTYAFAVAFSAGPATADVLTQRYNQERTGSVSQPGLNQSMFQDARWGLVGKLNVQGTVYAQPLVVENLQSPAAPRGADVVFIATAQNRIYSFDANTLVPVWPVGPGGISLGDNDKSKVGHAGCDGISGADGIGIEATPVIDRQRGVLFVSYRVNPSGDDLTARQRLRAVDVRTGATIQDVQVLPPNGPADSTVWHRSRAGLLLLNGVVYVAFTARCEDPGEPLTSIFHGWILAFEAATPRSVGAFETTSDPSPGQTIDGGGIWQGAGGLGADDDGNIYATTGNRRGAPYDNSPWGTQNLADSFVKLTPTISRRADGGVDHVDLRVADRFTPYRKIWLDQNDLDLSAAGPVVIPGSHYLLGGAKSGMVYVLDRGNMGRTDLAHYWDARQVAKVPLDAVQAEWPDDPQADHVVQKFRAAFNQYVPEGSPYLSHAGAPVASIMQNNAQEDAFAMGRDGALWVYWQAGNGPWTDGTSGRRGPAAITPSHLAPAHAAIATAKQGANQLDAFVVGNDGASYVTWEAGDGHWADGTPGNPMPARISPVNFAPPGSYLALANQSSDQLDAFVVGNDGAAYVSWVTGGGHWSDGTPGNPPPAPVTPKQFAPPGSGVAAALQPNNQLDVFVVGNDGAIHASWVVGLSHWSDGSSGNSAPAPISPQGLAPAGAPVAAANQTADQLDVFVVGNDGAIYVTWVAGLGHWSDGSPGNPAPARITSQNLAPKGACVTAVAQNDQQLDAFVVGNDGAIYVTSVVGLGHWSDGTPGNPSPARITPQGRAQPGSCVAALKPTAQQMNAFVTEVFGTLWITWEVNNGQWTDGSRADNQPVELTQAIWMRWCWWCWPHIHGSPVFAAFPGGRSMIYVWPEKDHLKAFPWLGDHIDADHRILGTDEGGKLVLAPPGPPAGMPGGMLAVSIDPGRTDTGVVWASIARTDNQDLGLLRAFDPFTLRELWNNGGADYRFVKFVPPTIARARVFLSTGCALAQGEWQCDTGRPNAVLVYGLRH